MGLLEMWGSSFLVTGLFGICIILVIKRILFLTKLPPGPWGIPIIGSLIHLNRNNALKEFEKYRQKYGQIFSVGIGDSNVIVINGYKLIQEALKLDALNGRPEFEIYKISNGGVQNRGILLCDGNETWNEQRRFVLRSLRDFGFGKMSMEGLLVYELDELIKHIRKNVGKPICPRQFFNASTFNSLWHLLTGNRFELDNEIFLKLVSMLTTTLQNAYIVGPGQFFLTPFKVLKREFWNSAKALRVEILNLVRTQVTEHEATYKDGVSRDFIDLYLHQRKSDPASSFGSEEGIMNLVVDLKDLFLAGAETTSTTLFWSILYLTQHPEVQVKVQAEIDAVIGRTRLPSREDKPKLVYLEAVLNEVHRKCSLVPVSVYHKVLQDTQIGGHFFPKGAVVFPNLYEAHHNRDYWKDPENFRPERFLNESGTALIKHEPLMPFSTGKRACLGEALARDTLFLFFTGLFQHFSWKLAPDSINAPLTDVPPTFIMSPKDFNVIITINSQ